jgi:hypothetical protein
MARVVTLILIVLSAALPMSGSRAYAYGAQSHEPIAVCASPMFRALMNTPLRDPRHDLAVAVYVLQNLHVVRSGPSDCPLDMPGRTYESLLLDYVDNQWIDDVTGSAPASAATVGDAIRLTAERMRSVTDVQADNKQFFARRQLAYDRTFEVVVIDPQATMSSWGQRIAIRVVNVSKWPIHWYAGLGRPPELWFRAIPGTTPAKFDCNLAGNDKLISVIAAGQRVDVSCLRQENPAVQDAQAPDLSALTRRDSWELRSPMLDSNFGTAERLDVSFELPEIQQQANALILRASCQDRGSCEIETSAHRNERNLALGPLAMWPIGLAGFLVGVILFFIVRFATGMSARRTAGVLTLILTAGMIAVTAFVLLAMKGNHDGFVLFGLGLVWFCVLIAVVPALAGIWASWVLVRQVTGAGA